MNMLKQLCQLFQPNSISSHKNLSIKHLPTIFNLQKCYHPVSFICEWSMPLYKIKRKEKYSSIEAELSLLVYLLYLFMGGAVGSKSDIYSLRCFLWISVTDPERFDGDPDPDPTFQADATDPAPDPAPNPNPITRVKNFFFISSTLVSKVFQNL